MATWVTHADESCAHRVVIMQFESSGVLLPAGPTSVLSGSLAPSFTVAQLDVDANGVADSAFTVEKDAYVVIQYMLKHVPQPGSQVEMQLVVGSTVYPGWAVPAGAFLGAKASPLETGPFNVELRLGSTLGTTVYEWYLKAEVFIPIA